MIRRAGYLIDAFQKAEGPPPRTLFAFFRWALQGSFPMLGIAAALSAAAGTAEVFTALILGWVIDSALAAGPDGFFSGHVLMLLAVLAFFVLVRPILFGLSSMANAVVVQPNVNPLVLSRLHRWTLGQSVTFFDNDFAGRIAQKQLQTARAVTDVAGETIQAGW